jgi:Tfp pilus assembly protein PilP
MKLRTGWWMVVIASGALWAQSAQPSAPAATSNAPAQTAAKPATTSTSAAKTTTTTKKTTKAKKKASAATTDAAPSGNVAKNVTSSSKAKRTVASSKRDPFVSPVQTRSNTPNNCGTGKRCLVLDQTRLEGIVKAPNGMIAVVANSANKAYFLRENDPVYNGFVMRITPDSVVFRETMTDRLGKKSTREVVKKVNAPVV